MRFMIALRVYVEEISMQCIVIQKQPYIQIPDLICS